jgi:hypothetical protein
MASTDPKRFSASQRARPSRITPRCSGPCRTSAGEEILHHLNLRLQFRTSTVGFVERGCWRIDGDYLLLNFWQVDTGIDVPLQRDIKLKILSVNKQQLRFLRFSDEVVAQRAK